MATELKYPSALPMSRNGSCLYSYMGTDFSITAGLKFNTGETSGWTQLDGSEEVEEGYRTIAFTQRDSPRIGGKVGIIPHLSIEDSATIKFQIFVQECSNGHKFWLDQTLTAVYTVTTNSGEEEVTLTYTLTDDDFQTTPAYPTDMPDVPFYWYLYYGYQPALGSGEGGTYSGIIVQTTTVAHTIIDIEIKSVEATPNNFFQPPGG